MAFHLGWQQQQAQLPRASQNETKKTSDLFFFQKTPIIQHLWSVFPVFREQVLKSEHEAFFLLLTDMILLRLFYSISKKLV